MKTILPLLLALIFLSGCGAGTQKQRISYEECIQECQKNRVCLEKTDGTFVPGAPNCKRWSDTTQCTNICVEKYK